MQILLSNSITGDATKIVNDCVSAVFQANNKDILSFDPSRTLFISNNTEEKSDFYFDVTSFKNDNRSYKMILLKNLANVIFSEYVDPRNIIGNYEILTNGGQITLPDVIHNPSPLVEEIQNLEKQLEVVKQEVASETEAVHSATISPESCQPIINGNIVG